MPARCRQVRWRQWLFLQHRSCPFWLDSSLESRNAVGSVATSAFTTAWGDQNSLWNGSCSSISSISRIVLLQIHFSKLLVVHCSSSQILVHLQMSRPFVCCLQLPSRYDFLPMLSCSSVFLPSWSWPASIALSRATFGSSWTVWSSFWSFLCLQGWFQLSPSVSCKWRRSPQKQ